MNRFFIVIAAFAGMPCTLLAQAGPATVLHNFTENEVNNNYQTTARVLQAADGNFYGLMNQDGIFFELQPNGTFTEPTTVDPRSGYDYSDLIQGPDGNFYFTVSGYYAADSCSGADCGSIDRITPSGVVTVLHTFNGTTDGANPLGPLFAASDGNFYGTASRGGDTSACATYSRVPGCGTLYRISPTGNFTVLYTFAGGASGGVPGMGLIQASDGNFYGVTSPQETGQYGVIFQFSSTGKYSVVENLPTSVVPEDDDYQSILTQGKDGALYGIGNDSVYKIAPGIGYSLVWQNSSEEQSIESDGLFPASDGNLYGALTDSVLSVFPGNGVGLTSQIPGNLFDVTQAADGGLVGTAGVGGTSGGASDGFIYELDYSPALPAPVQISFTPSTVSPGQTVQANLTVLNAFSVTMQQCYAFVTSNGTTTPLGKVVGSYNPKISLYTAEVSLVPSTAGTYTYAATCGGVESGYANLTVNGNPTTTGLAASPNLVMPPASATLTATVVRNGSNVAPTGTVTFYAGTLELGTATLNKSGVAMLSVSSQGDAAGTYPLTAHYGGDASDSPSTSVPVNVTVQ